MNQRMRVSLVRVESKEKTEENIEQNTQENIEGRYIFGSLTETQTSLIFSHDPFPFIVIRVLNHFCIQS